MIWTSMYIFHQHRQHILYLFILILLNLLQITLSIARIHKPLILIQAYLQENLQLMSQSHFVLTFLMKLVLESGNMC